MRLSMLLFTFILIFIFPLNLFAIMSEETKIKLNTLTNYLSQTVEFI